MNPIELTQALQVWEQTLLEAAERCSAVRYEVHRALIRLEEEASQPAYESDPRD